MQIANFKFPTFDTNSRPRYIRPVLNAILPVHCRISIPHLQPGYVHLRPAEQAATGALIGVTHNINYLYSNSPTAYTTNLQLSLTQPLLEDPPAGGQPGPAVGLEGQPGS